VATESAEKVALDISSLDHVLMADQTASLTRRALEFFAATFITHCVH
jgi:hypothetical protein